MTVPTAAAATASVVTGASVPAFVVVGAMGVSLPAWASVSSLLLNAMFRSSRAWAAARGPASWRAVMAARRACGSPSAAELDDKNAAAPSARSRASSFSSPSSSLADNATTPTWSLSPSPSLSLKNSRPEDSAGGLPRASTEASTSPAPSSSDDILSGACRDKSHAGFGPILFSRFLEGGRTLVGNSPRRAVTSSSEPAF
mmetsp:Transcript_37463/g.93128  ORF Transcript_37463/g.93128 Transcript_37463/m.93128 type:complete len:200 (+) Transcript_37463:738-1337(+)